MIVSPDLVSQILDIVRSCEEAIVGAYQNRPGNPNRIEFASFGNVRATRVPYIPFFNRVYGFNEAEAAKLPAILAFYRETNTPFRFWLSPGDVTENLARLLTANGFIPWQYHAKFYGVIDEIAPSLPGSKIETERVSPATLDDYLGVMLAGWGMPAEHQGEARKNMRLRHDIPGMDLFLSRRDGRALSGAVLYRQGDIAYLADAATPPANRGQGCQMTLMQARCTFAREQGCRLIVGAAGFGTSSFRNMQRLGLRVAFTDMAWHYTG